MPFVPTPALPDRTKIWHLGWMLYLRGDDMVRTGQDLRDVWLIGTYLSSFIIGVGNWIKSIYNFLNEIDTIIRNVLAWIRGITEENVIRDIIDTISGEYRDLRNNPTEWIKSRIVRGSVDLSLLFNYPVSWLTSKLRESRSWFGDFLDNTCNFIIGQLSIRAVWFITFISSPLVWLYNVISQRYPFINSLDINPFNWIIGKFDRAINWFYLFRSNPREFIKQRLSELSADIGQFLISPIVYIRNRIKAELGMTDIDLSDIALWSLKRVLQRINQYRGQIETMTESALSDIIMWFM